MALTGSDTHSLLSLLSLAPHTAPHILAAHSDCTNARELGHRFPSNLVLLVQQHIVGCLDLDQHTRR